MPVTKQEALDKIQRGTYLVGGAVRDNLLNLPIKDNDHLVIGCSVDDMLAADYIPVGKDFPVFLDPKTKEEYALARTEKKQGRGYTGFVCYSSPDVTIEEDLLRRDLTINAMARALTGELIDPYGGQDDLNSKVLRHVSDAFIEDPLRVLRVARFAARFYSLNFTIAPETLTMMSNISKQGELNELSGERIWQEMQRSLAGNNADVFFDVLHRCDALNSVWPDLNALWGIPNPPQWHPEICTGLHTMLVLTQACLLSTKTTVRFAALCHDLGKSVTDKKHWPSHPGHEKAGLPLIEKICLQLKIPNDHKKLALFACEYHLHIHKAFELKASTILKVLNALDVWRNPELFDDFLLTCQADFLGRLGFETRIYSQRDFMLKAMVTARSVSAKSFVEKGLKGAAIKEAMSQQRIVELKKLINEHRALIAQNTTKV